MLATVWIMFNVVVRTQWPTCYNPGLSANSSWYAHPYTARTIATIAELFFYYTMAKWTNVPSLDGFLGPLCIFGEFVSWMGVLLQSEFVGFLEDCVWTVHTVTMLYMSKTKP